MASATLFFGFSIGTALAPNLAAFFVFRILTAFQGTAFLVVGSAVIGDIYKPVRILCSSWSFVVLHEVPIAASVSIEADDSFFADLLPGSSCG